ncbi:MAG: type VI secretion system baseplate subunit TssK [Myxococcaceae bacterium]
MTTLQRVVWSEGMFMSPQHLQQQDLYHEALLAQRLAALSPYEWGVVAVEVDTEELSRGHVALRRFKGVLPSGLFLSFEAGDAVAPAARPAESLFAAQTRALPVYLAVAREREGIPSVANEHKPGTPTRWLVDSRPTADQLGTAEPIAVAYGRPHVELLFGNESRDDFETIQVAEITRDAGGMLSLAEAYVPPLLRIDASPSLMEGVRRLLRDVLSKQRELADARRFRDAATLEFTASDVTRYLQLSALNSLLPLLHHAVDAGNLHPQALYLQLLQAAGAFATFGADADPSSLPKFRFTQLRDTFGPLLDRLTQLLRGVSLERCISVPLESHGSGQYWGKLEDERLQRCPQFILGVRSELPEQLVADQLPKLAKIASRSQLSNLLRAATSGVPLQVTFRPPPEVSVKPGVVYFSLGLQDPYWKNALEEQNVAVFLPQTFDPARTQLELLAVPAGGPR